MVEPYLDVFVPGNFSITVKGKTHHLLLVPVTLIADKHGEKSHTFTLCIIFESVYIDVQISVNTKIRLALCVLMIIFNIMLLISCISFINGDLI